MKVKILNPEKNLSRLNFSCPTKAYISDEDFSDGGEDQRLAMEVFLINNELNGGKTIRTYVREFELEDGRVVECMGTVVKSDTGTPGMAFMLKKNYFEDEETQERVQTLCSEEFQNLFFEWHPKYFNKEWREKNPDMKKEDCYQKEEENG